LIDIYNLSNLDKDYLNEQIDEIAINMSNNNCEMIHDICQFIQKFLDEKNKLYNPIYNMELKSSNNNKMLCLKKSQKKHMISSKDQEQNQVYLDNLITKEWSKGVINIDFKNDALNEMETGASISRFKNDFIIIEKVGSGGGGVVYKVKNKYDGMFYAIKKVICFMIWLIDKSSNKEKVKNS